MISEGLVYSKPGVIELLPAWSPDLPNGSVQGGRCRTQGTVDLLEWDLEKKEVTATISSRKDQWVTLHLRQGVQEFETNTEVKPVEPGNMARMIRLEKGQSVQVKVVLTNAVNGYPVNTPAFTLEKAEADHAERIAKKKAKKK